MNEFNPHPAKKPSDVLSTEAEKHFLEEIVLKRINLNKIYKATDKEVDQFYTMSKLYHILRDQLVRQNKLDNGQEKVSGVLKFIKIKYDELIPTVETPTKFKRLTPTAKISYLKHLGKFCKSFKNNNEKIMFQFFKQFEQIIEMCVYKPINDLQVDEQNLMSVFLDLCKTFCFRFSFNKTLTESPKDKKFVEEVKMTHAILVEKLVKTFVDLNLLEMEKMGLENYGGIYKSDKKLTVWNKYLNLLAQCCHEEFRSVLSQNTSYESLAESSLEIWLNTMENHKSNFKGSDHKKLINDLLFYKMTIFSNSIHQSRKMIELYNEKQPQILQSLNANFKHLGLKTLEVTLLLVLINSSQDVKHKLEKLGQYSVVMKYKEQGINMGLEGLVEKNDMSDLLLKVRDVKQVLNPYVKRLFENMEPDYFQINDA